MNDVATPTTFRQAFIKFLTWTSIRGVPRIFKEKSLHWKVLWTITIVAFLATTVYQVSELIMRYATFETSYVQTVFVPKERIPFPSVTFCNQQPFTGKISRLKREGKLNNVTLLPDYLKRVEDYLERRPNALTKTQKDVLYRSLYTVEGYFQNVPVETIDKISQSNEELVLEYNYLWDSKGSLVEEKGNVSEAFVFLHSQFLKCYTISLDKIPDQVFKLQAIVYMDDEITFDLPPNFIYNTNMDKHGAKVALHDLNTIPFIDQDLLGWPIPPGVSQNYLLQTNWWTQMKPPFGKCREGLEDLVTKHGYRFRYSQKLCEAFCRQNYVKATCKCIDPALPSPKGVPFNFPFCGSISTDVKTLQRRVVCMQNIRDNFYALVPEEHCDCPERCNYYDFKPQVTSSIFPHQSMTLAYQQALQEYIPKIHPEKFAFYEKVRQKLKENDTEGARKLLLQKPVLQQNIARVVIAFPERRFRVLHIEEVPKIDCHSLLSNIGGSLSLYLGITVIAAVECVEMFIDLIKVAYMKCQGKSKVAAVGSDRADGCNGQSESSRGNCQPNLNLGMSSISTR